MIDISTINTAIITGNFTNDQLTSINQAVQYARAQIATQNKFTFLKVSNQGTLLDNLKFRWTQFVK